MRFCRDSKRNSSNAHPSPLPLRCPLPPQVRDLLSETGQVLALWMPSIKTHAYCVFETKAQAEATRRVSLVQRPGGAASAEQLSL